MKELIERYEEIAKKLEQEFETLDFSEDDNCKRFAKTVKDFVKICDELDSNN